MKFKAGDRVRVYAISKGEPIESVGKVYSIFGDNKMLSVLLDGSHLVIAAHPKQCRLLKKKVRRRIWIHEKGFGSEYLASSYITFSLNEFVQDSELQKQWIEFVEVKKK